MYVCVFPAHMWKSEDSLWVSVVPSFHHVALWNYTQVFSLGSKCFIHWAIFLRTVYFIWNLKTLWNRDIQLKYWNINIYTIPLSKDILYTKCFCAFQSYPNIISFGVTYYYISNWLASVLAQNDWRWTETGRVTDEELWLALATIGNGITHQRLISIMGLLKTASWNGINRPQKNYTQWCKI